MGTDQTRIIALAHVTEDWANARRKLAELEHQLDYLKHIHADSYPHQLGVALRAMRTHVMAAVVAHNPALPLDLYFNDGEADIPQSEAERLGLEGRTGFVQLADTEASGAIADFDFYLHIDDMHQAWIYELNRVTFRAAAFVAGRVVYDRTEAVTLALFMTSKRDPSELKGSLRRIHHGLNGIEAMLRRWCDHHDVELPAAPEADVDHFARQARGNYVAARDFGIEEIDPRFAGVDVGRTPTWAFDNLWGAGLIDAEQYAAMTEGDDGYRLHPDRGDVDGVDLVDPEEVAKLRERLNALPPPVGGSHFSAAKHYKQGMVGLDELGKAFRPGPADQ